MPPFAQGPYFTNIRDKEFVLKGHVIPPTALSGSTITQPVSKNHFLQPSKESISRKLGEALGAFDLR